MENTLTRLAFLAGAGLSLRLPLRSGNACTLAPHRASPPPAFKASGYLAWPTGMRRAVHQSNLGKKPGCLVLQPLAAHARAHHSFYCDARCPRHTRFFYSRPQPDFVFANGINAFWPEGQPV